MEYITTAELILERKINDVLEVIVLMGRPEDSRVKIPALVHFTRLGYTYMSIKDEVERKVP